LQKKTIVTIKKGIRQKTENKTTSCQYDVVLRLVAQVYPNI